MHNILKPYKPAHPKAPKASRRAKGVLINAVNKAETKKIYSIYPHERFSAAHKECTLTNKERTKILRAFAKNLAQTALTNRAGVLLPNRMGKLQVLMYPHVKQLKKDNYTSEKFGVVVHHSKLKNAGKFPLATLDVYSDSYNMANKKLWQFAAAPSFRKAQFEEIQKNRTGFDDAKLEYILYYRKEKFYRKEYVKEQSAELLKTYNEFEGII